MENTGTFQNTENKKWTSQIYIIYETGESGMKENKAREGVLEE